MRHYEIILMFHPDKSEKVSQIIDFYKNIISKSGLIHRLEDWGKRSLSYTINKLKKAHYFLMNVEISVECMQYLENHFKFNATIIRSLILSCPIAFKKTSIMMSSNSENNTSDVLSSNKKEIKIRKESNY